MADSVSYGGFNFSSVCGEITPFVGVSDEQVIVGGKWKILKTVTVQGRIVPSSSDYCPESQGITQKVKSLLDGLKNDFVSLNAGGINLPIARCQSADITQSNFFGTADFTVNFTGYPNELSFTTYSVLDPVDSKQISENKDGTIVLTRRISARGISTSQSPNAVSNARSFISSLNPDAAPQIFFQIGQLKNPEASIAPRKKVETINRMDGSVSLDIEYIYRSSSKSSSTLFYTIDINYDDKTGLYSASINGNLVGTLTSTKDSLKSDFNQLNTFNLVQTKFSKLTGFSYLNKIPENYNIIENSENNSMNFSYTYTSDPYDIKRTISYAIIYNYEKDITSINLNGNITARGSQSKLKEKLEKEFSSIDFYKLASDRVSKSGKPLLQPLSKEPTDYNITRSKFDGETTTSIQFNITYTNEYLDDPAKNFFQINYTLSCTPSIDIYNPVQFLRGDNGIFDMQFYKRGVISIQGNAIGKNATLNAELKKFIEAKLDTFANDLGVSKKTRIVTESRITSNVYSDNGYIYDFVLSENCETRVEKL